MDFIQYVGGMKAFLAVLVFSGFFANPSEDGWH